MCNEEVNESTAAPAESATQQQSSAASPHLFLRVLIRTLPIAMRSTQSANSKARDVHDAPIDIRAALCSGVIEFGVCKEVDRGGGLPLGCQVGVVVTGHIDERLRKGGHEILEIVERQIPAGDNQVRLEVGKSTVIGEIANFVGDREDSRHVSILLDSLIGPP